MGEVREKGFPLIGAIFLLLGLFKLFSGGDWVVWIILGVVFGGVGMFGQRKGEERS
jgi:hypothetical protein